MAEKKKSKYYVRPDGIHESIRAINGKRVAFRGKTDREVDRKILAYREEAAKGRRFPVIADEWERAHEAEVTESSRITYAYAVKRLKAAFPGLASEIRPLDIQRYLTRLAARGRSASSVHLDIAVCRMIFQHAVLSGDIDVSPAAEVKRPRGLPVKKREALTEEQERAVRACEEARGPGDVSLGFLLMHTGLRRGEALALQYSDIDRRAGVIHITKKLSYATGTPVLEERLKSGRGERNVPLLPPLAERLPKNRVGLIFPGKDGGFLRASELKSLWRAYCREAGLNEIVYGEDGNPVETFPITPHCFRHSFATICYEAGIDPRQTAEFLGDTTEVVEGVYTHLRQEHRQTAAEKLAAYFEAKKIMGE